MGKQEVRRVTVRMNNNIIAARNLFEGFIELVLLWHDCHNAKVGRFGTGSVT